MSAVYDFIPGDSAVLVSIPHGGVEVPGPIAQRMHDHARALPDTDWHVAELYEFAPVLGAAVLSARFSRYVIDLNRGVDGAALYRGADNTELCPTTAFDRQPIYRDGRAPDPEEIAARVETYWRPYHERLSREIEQRRRRFGYAIVLDAHSIAARVPRFFEGRLPDFNLGTNGGQSCADSVRRNAERALDRFDVFSRVTDGRFRGGYITRHYGQPDRGVHAIQLELSQATYLGEDGHLDPAHVDEVRPALRALVSALVATDIARPEASARA